MRILLVLGGTSDIGRATALAYATDGWKVQLAGRDVTALQREADDIVTRTGTVRSNADPVVTVHRLDILDTGSFAAFLDSLPALPDTVVCVVGLLGEQTRAQDDLEHAVAIMRTNYEGPALMLGLIANRFVARGHGTIVGVSSVAGERGRASNYVYGSAKAGFTTYLSGLRNRLAHRGVHVLTVKPGFVRTRMTRGMKLPGILTAEPALVGREIYQAAKKHKDVVYVYPSWRLIMGVIKAIPEGVFKKGKL
jgi:NAD(P)-dependent dehydrogenase (short-subunit alcohol dehydrogenase family)